MDYLAFILFGVGILLVIAGYFFNHERKGPGFYRNFGLSGAANMNKQRAAPNMTANTMTAPQQADYQTSAPTPAPISMGSQNPDPPQPYIPRVNMPQEPNPQPDANANYQVDVHVRNENPKLFQKSAYLYTDSGSNSYTGTEKVFQFQDVVGIRRFGQGIFSYDGFCFNFDHTSGVEKYQLQKIDHIAFYPNCVVLVLKSGLPAALFFVDETESLRKILETFKVDG